MAGQYRFKDINGNIVAQISASAAGAISFSGSAVDFSNASTITLGQVQLAGTASNALLLDGFDSTAFVFTSSFNIISQSISSQLTTLQTTSGSNIGRLDNLESKSSSVDISISNINSVTSSVLSRTSNLESKSSSVDISISNINSVTASNIARLSNLETKSSSVDISITNINSITASNLARLTNLETKSASVDISVSSINTFTSSNGNTSLNTFTASNDITSLNSKTGSYATTGSNTFFGTQTYSGSVYIANDLVVQGSSSIQYISASSVSIGTNIVQLNTANPSIRFAGLTMIDSGSVGGSGSFLYDSLQDEFIFVHRGNGTNVTSSHFVTGPETYDSLGNETYLTCNVLTKGTGKEHLVDSCIFDNGTTTCIKNNLIGTGTMSGTTIYGSTAVCSPIGLFSGCVGIGTTSPGRTLHILGQTGIGTVLKLEGAAGTTTYLQLSYNGATNAQSGYIGYDSSANMPFFTNDTERLRITCDGYVAVTGNQGLKCVPYLQGMSFGWNRTNGQGESMINWTNAGGGTACDLVFNFRDSSTLYERLRIASTGAATFSSTITGTTIYGSTAVCSPVGLFSGCVGIGISPQSILETFGASPVVTITDSNAFSNLVARTSGIEFKAYNPSGNITTQSAGIYGVITPETGYTPNQGYLTFYTRLQGASYTEKMRITSCGKVGIIATDPKWLLEICCNTTATGGGGYPAISINNPNNAGYSAYYFHKGSTNFGGMELSNATCHLFVNTLCTFAIQTSGTERLRISLAGTSTFTTTENQGGVYVTSATDNTTIRVASSLSGGQEWRLQSTGGDSGLGQGKLIFKVGGTETASYIPLTLTTDNSTNGGRVGIGTTTPAYSLSVKSGWIHNYGAQNASGFRYENDASGHILNMNANNSYAQLYTGTTTALYFGSNNILSLGINTSGHVIAISDNAYTMGASGNRWSAIWSANGTIQTSDEREKKDITNTDLGLDFISNLRPVSYKWKVGQNIVTREPDGLDENGNEQFKIVKTPREGTRVHYGLIAQEVKQVLGDKDFGGYIHDEDTDIKGLRYDQFIAPLIKAIQEQQCTICSQATMINILKTCIGIN